MVQKTDCYWEIGDLKRWEFTGIGCAILEIKIQIKKQHRILISGVAKIMY